MPVNERFALIYAANYLDIKGLLLLAATSISLLINGKSPEKIREVLGLPDPEWTEEELKKLEEENSWAYDTKEKTNET